MKVLHYGIFQDHELGGDIVLHKGLVQNGCEVTPYDYRSQIKTQGHQASEQALIGLAEHADLLLIGKGEKLSPNTLSAIQQKGVHTALWYGDIRVPPNVWLLNLLPYVDTFFMSSGGDTLKNHFDLGEPKTAAYMLNPCDPDLVKKYENLPTTQYEVLFTGSAYGFAGSDRKKTIEHLKQRGDVTFFGGAQQLSSKTRNTLWHKLKRELSKLGKRRKIRGADYIRAIKSAKVGIGLSAIHNVDKYTSDRLSHYTAFGTCYLAHEFRGLDSLFTEEEIPRFATLEQLDKQLAFLLNDDAARASFAHNAQQKMLTHYNTKNMVAMMLDVIEKRSSDRFEWVEIVRR